MPRITQADYDSFKQAFELFDKDGSGSISIQQIKEVFKQLRINIKGQQLEQVMRNFDENGDNSIQFQQFLLVVSAHLQQPQSQGWMFEVFQTIDEDCDGIITKKQLVKAIQLFGLEIQEKQIDLIMEQGDSLLEGGINFEQYSKLLKL